MKAGITVSSIAVKCSTCGSEAGHEPRIRLQAQQGGKTLLVLCLPCRDALLATLARDAGNDMSEPSPAHCPLCNHLLPGVVVCDVCQTITYPHPQEPPIEEETP